MGGPSVAGETEQSRDGTSSSVRPGALSALLQELAARRPPSPSQETGTAAFAPAP